jgi:hypothetical protein
LRFGLYQRSEFITVFQSLVKDFLNGCPQNTCDCADASQRVASGFGSHSGRRLREPAVDVGRTVGRLRQGSR